MARPEQRKARKDYPQNGIKAGDLYWYVKLKLQRGGQVKRSLTPFKPSQLTNSGFKSAFLAAGEDWEASDKDADAMRSAAEAIRSAGEEAQGSFDNMPEGLQQGDTGQSLENRASECSRIADELDSLADELEGLDDEPAEFDEDEPVEPLGDLETDEENEAATTAYEEAFGAWETARDEAEAASSEWHAEVERIIEEADSMIGDMPE